MVVQVAMIATWDTCTCIMPMLWDQVGDALGAKVAVRRFQAALLPKKTCRKNCKHLHTKSANVTGVLFLDLGK